MTKNTLPEEMRIACCLTCTLSEPMKDCKSCPFNIGLVFKGLKLIKQAERAANVSAFERFASGYLANVPNGAK